MFNLSSRLNGLKEKLNKFKDHSYSADPKYTAAAVAVEALNKHCTTPLKTLKSFLWGEGLTLRLQAWRAVNVFNDFAIVFMKQKKAVVVDTSKKPSRPESPIEQLFKKHQTTVFSYEKQLKEKQEQLSDLQRDLKDRDYLLQTLNEHIDKLESILGDRNYEISEQNKLVEVLREQISSLLKGGKVSDSISKDGVYNGMLFKQKSHTMPENSGEPTPLLRAVKVK